MPLGDLGDERVHELRWVAPTAGESDAAASNLGWARRATSRPVLGREAPVAELEAAWAAAQAGERRVVVVAGDPGIGKTTVAAELALRAHAGGGTVLYGRWDEDGLAPYQAVREALGSYAAACPRPLLRADVAGRGRAGPPAARRGDPHRRGAPCPWSTTPTPSACACSGPCGTGWMPSPPAGRC